MQLQSLSKLVPALSDSLLGGSAPRLRSIRLNYIPFPGLPKLLSSTSDLVHLDLRNVPESGYISPETMVTSLSSLTQLKILGLGFQPSRSRPGLKPRYPSPQAHVFLLNVTHFRFQGVSEYLERLVAYINAPSLHSVKITLFNELSSDISEFPQFIDRSEQFRSLNRADLGFFMDSVKLKFSPQTRTADGLILALSISCEESDWHPSSLSHVFGSSLPPLATSERLEIHASSWLSQRQYDMRNIQWLDPLRPFTAVKDLHLSEKVAVHVAPALEDVAEGSVEKVLPFLRNIFLEGLQRAGPVQEASGKFASRQLSNYPIAVHCWERQ